MHLPTQGARIRRAREGAGLSPAQLCQSELGRSTNLDEHLLADIEADTARPDPPQLLAIAWTTGVRVNQLTSAPAGN